MGGISPIYHRRPRHYNSSASVILPLNGHWKNTILKFPSTFLLIRALSIIKLHDLSRLSYPTIQSFWSSYMIVYLRPLHISQSSQSYDVKLCSNCRKIQASSAIYSRTRQSSERKEEVKETWSFACTEWLDMMGYIVYTILLVWRGGEWLWAEFMMLFCFWMNEWI